MRCSNSPGSLPRRPPSALRPLAHPGPQLADPLHPGPHTRTNIRQSPLPSHRAAPHRAPPPSRSLSISQARHRHPYNQLVLEHVRHAHIAPVMPVRSPLCQAFVGPCRYINEDEFAAQCCYIGPISDDCEAAAVTLRTLKWQFVRGAVGFDLYEILGVGVQDPAASLTPVRARAGSSQESRCPGVVLESSERQRGTGRAGQGLWRPAPGASDSHCWPAAAGPPFWQGRRQ